MVHIAILGHGVVGSGVADIITTHKTKLFACLGEEVYIKYILDIRDFPESPLEDRFTKNFEDIINDIDIRIVVEVIGGIKPAFEYVKRSLEAGKSVVTSNKELVAGFGAELLKTAKENNANFLFEASVGGGIPIIRPINQCLVANNVDEIAGILNGTTNFILTKMVRDNMNFDDALKLAQNLGYAERNPEADIMGHDACRKICILASLTFGCHIYPEWVHTEGITEITLRDVSYAAAWGGCIKLIGRVKIQNDGSMDIIVSPMFVPSSSQLANIDYEFNGIMVRGDCTGDVVFYGKGAGKLPTASAVVADIVDCCKHFKTRKYLFWSDGSSSNVIDYNDSVFAYYVLLASQENHPIVLENTGEQYPCAAYNIEEIEKTLGKIALIRKPGVPNNELAFTTEQMSWETLNERLELLKQQKLTVLSVIRIGDL